MDATLGSMLLGSVRVASALLLIPQMLGAGVPTTFKVMLVLALSYFMGKVSLPAEFMPLTQGDASFLYGCAINELVIGMTMGLGVLLAYTAFVMSGKLLDTQMGLAMGQIYDPTGGQNGTIVASLFSQFALLMLFSLQYHHHLFRQLAYSFEQMPMCGNGHFSLLQAMDFDHFGELLGLGFFMAAPFVLCFFAIDLVVAVIAQAAPQFNALLLSMGVKIGLGILLLALSGPQLQRMVSSVYQTAMDRWDALLEMVSPIAPEQGSYPLRQGGGR